jgi:hypothetical protein
MQNRNVHDQEKDGYSDIVDEMQVTVGCSSTVLIDAEGAGLLENSSYILYLVISTMVSKLVWIFLPLSNTLRRVFSRSEIRVAALLQDCYRSEIGASSTLSFTNNMFYGFLPSSSHSTHLLGSFIFVFW